MSKKKIPSMNKQVYDCIQSINVTDDMDKRIEMYEKLTGEAFNGSELIKRDFKDKKIQTYAIFSHNGVENMLVHLKAFANDCKQQYGIKYLKDITPEMSIKYLEMKMSKDCSPDTIKTLKSYQMKLSKAIEYKYGYKNAVYDKTVKNFKVPKVEKPNRVYTNDQINQILNHAVKKSKYGSIMDFQIRTGLRVSELVKLTSDDIIFEGYEVRHKKYGNINTTNTIRVKKGKGGLLRYVPMQEKDIEYFREIKSQLQPGQRVFKGLNRNNYSRAISRIGKRLGLGKRGPTHEFRKAYASNLYNSLVNSRELSLEQQFNIAGYVVYTLGHGFQRRDLIYTYLGLKF